MTAGGIGYLLPGTGPGTGPIVPVPLHGYGRTDATRRYVADRLPGAVGSVVTTLPDQIGSNHLVTLAGETQQLAIAAGPGGAGKSVAQPNQALTNPQRQRLGVGADTALRTVVQVLRTPTNDGTRVVFESGAHRWRLARAANGSMSVAPTSGTGGSGLVTTGWVSDWSIIACAVNPNDGTAMLKRLGQAAVTGTLTLSTAAGTHDSMFFADVAARDSQIAEQLTFSPMLTSTEMETVMQALATRYGLA